MDIILYNIFVPICCLLIGYLFGSVPTALWVGKIFFHQDITQYGSHNPGGTNAGRLWGKKVGFGIILFDMFKSVAPMWICWAILTFVPMYQGSPLIATAKEFYTSANATYVIQWPAYWLAALGCMIGNCYSVFAKFKGGKGVSVFMGLIVFSSWLLGFIPGLFYFLFLKLTKTVSITSILTSILASIFAWTWTILILCKIIPTELTWLPMYGPTLTCGYVYSSVVTLMSLIIIFRHKENIQRLKRGEERKITWMK